MQNQLLVFLQAIFAVEVLKPRHLSKLLIATNLSSQIEAAVSKLPQAIGHSKPRISTQHRPQLNLNFRKQKPPEANQGLQPHNRQQQQNCLPSNLKTRL